MQVIVEKTPEIVKDKEEDFFVFSKKTQVFGP